MKLLIKNGRVIDPASGTDETLDILIVQNAIADIKARIDGEADRIIDASRLVVAPGFIDMHVHLREPGFEDKETILTGSRAAAKGGFTTICCMPNTNPVNDSREVTEQILSAARKTGLVHVYPVAAISKGLRGAELSEMIDLVRAGAVAFSDDGHSVADSLIMRQALETSLPLRTLVIDHCEDKSLTKGGSMHEGAYSASFGLRGMPAAAEEIMVARDIILAETVKAPVHIAHLSVEGSVRAVKEAKARGVRVSAEASPHHLTLWDSLLQSHNPDLKMNPPLRSKEDVEALVEAIKDGTIDAIATDHAPHTIEDKAAGFEKAPFGVVGLETAVPVLLDRLVIKNIISIMRFIELLSTNPARLLGLKSKGTISVGADADLTLLNLHKETVVDKSHFESKGRNTPFQGWKLKGLAVMTIVSGRVIFPFDQMTNPEHAASAGTVNRHENPTV